MIVIKTIQFKEVPNDIYQLLQEPPLDISLHKTRFHEVSKQLEVTTEEIFGKQFVTAEGERICLGLSKQVQKLIGLPFEVIDSQQRLNEKLHVKISTLRNNLTIMSQELNQLNYHINMFKNLPFWQRAQFLCQGVKFWVKKEKERSL